MMSEETEGRSTDARADGYALGLGTLLTIVGVRGLSRARVLGVVGMNRLHAVIHLAVGIAGVVAGARRRGRTYAGAVGAILLAEGALGVVPQVRERLVTLLNVNAGTTAVQFALGACSIVVYRDTAED